MIKGELGPVSVPGLFRTIADENRTGLLTMSSVGGHDAFIYFRDGNLEFARLQPSRVELGPRLVSAGLVSTEEVEQALVAQKGAHGIRRLGEVLVGMGLLQRQQLQAIVKEQFEDTIFEIINWHAGSFSFEPGELSEEDVGFEVSVESLAAMGEIRLRQWNEISKLVPTFDAVPEFMEDNNAPSEVTLTPEEWSFISRLDGRLSIAQLAQSCGFTHLEAGRCISGLVSTGLLTLVPPEDWGVSIDEKEVDGAVKDLQDSFAASGSRVGLEEMFAAGGGAAEALEEAEVDEPELIELPDPQLEQVEMLEPEPIELFETEPETEPEPEPETVELFDAEAERETEPEPEPETVELIDAEPEAEQEQIELLETEPNYLSDYLPVGELEEPGEPTPQEPPAPAPKEIGPRITMPASSYEVIPSSIINGDRGIVAEELVEEGDSLTKILAELSRGVEGELPPPPPPETNGDQLEPAVEEAPKSGRLGRVFSDPQPVDPLVDTTALIRELASYSSTKEEPPTDQTTVLTPDEDPPHKPGLFGRKRKR